MVNEYTEVASGSNGFVDVSDASLAVALRLVGNEPVNYAEGFCRLAVPRQCAGRREGQPRVEGRRDPPHVRVQV